MKNSPEIKDIKQFVQQRLKKIFYSKHASRLLLERINRFITNSDFGGIVGEYGTGKKQIVDEIIGPVLAERYGLISKSKYELYDNVYRIDEVLSGSTGKALIVSEFDPLLLVDGNLFPKLRLYHDSLTDHDIIRVPSLQENYIDYPEIIANIFKQEGGILAKNILIDFCGYTESIISGMPRNYRALLNLIIDETISGNEMKEWKTLSQSRKGLILRYNSYLNTLPKRKELWKFFWNSSNHVPLVEIQEFNREYQKQAKNIGVPISGPFRKLHQQITLERLREYCRALISNFNNGLVEKTVLLPIDNKIAQIINPIAPESKMVGWLYIFSSEDPSKKKQTHSIASDKDVGSVDIPPQREIEEHSIILYDTLTINLRSDLYYNKKIIIQLSGDDHKSSLIEINNMEAAFLMYLGYERKKGESKWLVNPEAHVTELNKIFNHLNLPDYFENEIRKKPTDPQTWIWDFNNKNRKTIVTRINSSLRKFAKIEGVLFKVDSKAHSWKRGIYSLIKIIEKFKIS